MHGYEPGTYGASFADVYDDWYGEVSDVAGTVTGLTALAGGGRVLELGVGTGRLALPLAAAGGNVVGVDASPEMVRELAAKPDAASVAVCLADMTALPVRAGSCRLAFAAFNTFFNLTDDDAQRRCVREVASALEPGGRFVVEGFVPPEDGLADGGVSVRDVTLDTAVLTISRHDPETQTITGQHVQLSGAGVRMRPWMLHYLSPTQLDEIATDAGFSLESRHADWAGSSFDTRSSASHVSVYRLDAPSLAPCPPSG